MADFNFAVKTGVGGVFVPDWTPFGLYSACFYPAPVAPNIGIMNDSAIYGPAFAANITALSAFFPPEPVTCPDKQTLLDNITSILSARNTLIRGDEFFGSLALASNVLVLMEGNMSPSFVNTAGTGWSATGPTPGNTADYLTQSGLGLASNPGVILHGVQNIAHIVDGVYVSSDTTVIGAPFVIPPGDYIKSYSVQGSGTFGASGATFQFTGNFLDSYGPAAVGDIWPECAIAPSGPPQLVRADKMALIGTAVSMRKKCCC